MPATFADPRDGKVYKTVQIGENIWMAENLAYPIGGRYYNDDPEYGKKYRLLYDWDSAINACPPGWHLPNNEEWMEVSLRCCRICRRLERKGLLPAYEKAEELNLDFGFAAQAGGFGKIRNGEESFSTVGRHGYWWSLSDENGWYAYYWGLDFDKCCLKKNASSKKLSLFSVRCVKD